MRGTKQLLSQALNSVRSIAKERDLKAMCVDDLMNNRIIWPHAADVDEGGISGCYAFGVSRLSEDHGGVFFINFRDSETGTLTMTPAYLDDKIAEISIMEESPIRQHLGWWRL